MLTETIIWHPVSEQLPDADLTVHVATQGCEEPVWLGFLDGETWRDVDGMEITVTHWAEMLKGPSAADARMHEQNSASVQPYVQAEAPAGVPAGPKPWEIPGPNQPNPPLPRDLDPTVPHGEGDTTAGVIASDDAQPKGGA